MADIRVGQRLVLGMMVIITLLVLPIIWIICEALGYQSRYNDTLGNLRDISYIVQESEIQGYRIMDYCTMNKEIASSGETEIVIEMLDCVKRIRKNIGSGTRYKENLARLQIVENLLMNYAQDYKVGVGKCGKAFSLAGDMEFYSMTDTSAYIVKNCNMLLSLEMNRSEDLKNEISTDFRRMLVTVAVLVAADIALMVFLAQRLSNRITDPLNLLMAHIAEISESGLLRGEEVQE